MMKAMVTFPHNQRRTSRLSSLGHAIWGRGLRVTPAPPPPSFQPSSLSVLSERDERGRIAWLFFCLETLNFHELWSLTTRLQLTAMGRKKLATEEKPRAVTLLQQGMPGKRVARERSGSRRSISRVDADTSHFQKLATSMSEGLEVGLQPQILDVH